MDGRSERTHAGQRAGRRLIPVLVALVLVLGIVVGGTVAWLVAKSTPVVNTFTYGDINIDLEETDTQKDDDQDSNTNEYEMLPGANIDKDPKVTVEANSVNNWLFVKLEKSANFDDFMTYEIAEGWTALAGAQGVYYREVEKSDADQVFSVLKDDQVTVKENVTKEALNALDADPANATYPTLTVTAYSVQKSGFDTAADAWTVASANP